MVLCGNRFWDGSDGQQVSLPSSGLIRQTQRRHTAFGNMGFPFRMNSSHFSVLMTLKRVAWDPTEVKELKLICLFHQSDLLGFGLVD